MFFNFPEYTGATPKRINEEATKVNLCKERLKNPPVVENIKIMQFNNNDKSYELRLTLPAAEYFQLNVLGVDKLNPHYTHILWIKSDRTFKIKTLAQAKLSLRRANLESSIPGKNSSDFFPFLFKTSFEEAKNFDIQIVGCCKSLRIEK